MSHRLKIVLPAIFAASVALCGISCSDSEGGVPDRGISPDSGNACAADIGTPRAMTWVQVPAGSFTMGCSTGDGDCYSSEKPAHPVTVAALELTSTEITQHQYKQVIGKEPSTFICCPDCPVDSVTWTEAKAYCDKVGGRLPSEAEWEYAARAGTASRFTCGDDASCLTGIAWFKDNSGLKTHPVASKPANTFGLYDMLGNVWEWVADHWHEDYTGAPTDGKTWSTGGNASYRLLRGGCYGLTTRGMRISNRERDYPDSYMIAPPGFRCARDKSASADGGVSPR